MSERPTRDDDVDAAAMRGLAGARGLSIAELAERMEDNGVEVPIALLYPSVQRLVASGQVTETLGALNANGRPRRFYARTLRAIA